MLELLSYDTDLSVTKCFRKQAMSLNVYRHNKRTKNNEVLKAVCSVVRTTGVQSRNGKQDAKMHIKT